MDSCGYLSTHGWKMVAFRFASTSPECFPIPPYPCACDFLVHEVLFFVKAATLPPLDDGKTREGKRFHVLWDWWVEATIRS